MPESTLIIVGPTASGKTRLAAEVARRAGACILSADSRQVYRGMDIGTGKDREEYGNLPVEGLDLLEPGCEFSLWDFLNLARHVLARCQKTRQPLIVAGGTGLYVSALAERYQLTENRLSDAQRRWLDGLDHAALRAELLRLKPAQHNLTDLEEATRTRRALEIAMAEAAGAPVVQFEGPICVVGLQCAGRELRQRIRARLLERVQNGLVEEVARLRQQGVSDEWLMMIGLEYRYVTRFLTGALNRNDMMQQLEAAIYEYARKQNKWYRRMARNGVEIYWLDAATAAPEQVMSIWEQHDHAKPL
ncbi:MAG: tRNA (adenosine(37)-N6)-dimethylallyltransferase MiaA [Gammaproteobacteria bacterium]|nr:MAG: tRNA (adenosine(37)-N6)-dimethylallyltransferase MiaA [Gammaproteobacteria bacterium]